jgi:hypothetical protein
MPSEARPAADADTSRPDIVLYLVRSRGLSSHDLHSHIGDAILRTITAQENSVL